MAHTKKPRSGRQRLARMVGLVAVLALVISACGDDDDDSGSAATDTTAAGTTAASSSATTAGSTATTGAATTTTLKPVAGGEMTMLMSNEIAGLDPVAAGTSAGTDALRMFPLYGALVTYVDAEAKVKPYFADSVTSNPEFTVWTIKVKPGITFTDGAAYDAEAVRANWARVQDPANRSPGVSAFAAIASMAVKDPLTFEVTLKTPNAWFPNTISLFGALNYMASPKAIATAPADLKTKPVGAGPFVLQEWIRDDHISFTRNPNFFFKPAPYLDKLTVRTVIDETQRNDTFLKGDADANYTGNATSIANAEKAGKQAQKISLAVGQDIFFNTSAPPFDDIRVRQAFAMGIDRDAMVKVVIGPDAKAPTTWGRPGTIWDFPNATIPAYNKAEAQKLFNTVAAETGGPIKFTMNGSQGPGQKLVEFVQTSLNALDNVEVDTNVTDFTTNVQLMYAYNYQANSWGNPYHDPEPRIYNGLHSNLFANYAKYANPTVDQALDAARATSDNVKRKELYTTAFNQVAKDLPWLPYNLVTNAVLYNDKLHDVQIWEDGIPRFDLIWKKA